VTEDLYSVGKVKQNQPADDGIKRSARLERAHVGLLEVDVLHAGGERCCWAIWSSAWSVSMPSTEPSAPTSGMRVLDLGTGLGHVALQVAEHPSEVARAQVRMGPSPSDQERRGAGVGARWHPWSQAPWMAMTSRQDL